MSVDPKVEIQRTRIVDVGIGGSGGLDPITLKGDVTFLPEAKTNTGRSEPAVGFSGTAGLGMSAKPFGGDAEVYCFRRWLGQGLRTRPGE